MTSASLSDAAKKLGRTQPAVSAAIKSLETQLGLQLFDRVGRKLVPLPEAQYLLVETSEILSQLARVRTTMHSMADSQAGTLTVAAMSGAVSILFPNFLATKVVKDTGIKVSLLARSSNQIAELARAQSLDFGFGDAPDEGGLENLCVVEYVAGRCSVALPKDHPLVEKEQICLRDLEHERMGSLLNTHAHHKDVRRCFEAQGMSFQTRIECQTFLPLLQFIGAGSCCAIVDPLTVLNIAQMQGESGNIVIRPLVEKVCYRYAIIESRFRPVSALAKKARAAWRKELFELLESADAEPFNEEMPYSIL